MSETVAAAVVAAVGIYLALGVAFAIPFVLRGAGRIDPAARRGTWGFRLAILPGAAALWPLLARRWIRGGPRPEERNAHRDAARRARTAGESGPTGTAGGGGG